MNYETSTTENNPKKRKYARITCAFLGASLLFAGYAGLNAWNLHKFDKYVTKQIEIAANVPSVSSAVKSDLSMESALTQARSQVFISSMNNPALIWKTPLTQVDTLEDLLGKATERAHQIGEFQEAFATGKITSQTPAWVVNAYNKLDLKRMFASLTQEQQKVFSGIAPSFIELAESEFGQRIASEYESLNSAVAGGTRTQAKSISERNRSLLDTLDKAAGYRSIIRLQATDYKASHAHVFIGYLFANMGYVSEGVAQIEKAKAIMSKYPAEKNLALFRDTPELSQQTINALLDSSIKELKSLDADPSKYSTGWWKRLRYYNQSIGGQSNPCIQDVSEAIEDRYMARLKISGALALIGFYFAGKMGKRLRNAKRYEVPSHGVD